VAIGLLGPLEATRDGQPVSVTAPKERVLLALLAVHANRVVPVERLLEELWPGRPPARARAALQTRVSALRRLLHGEDDDQVLVTQPAGYLLRVDDDDLDASRFERLVAGGRQRASAGDDEAAVELFRAALGLWQGPALADVDRTVSLQAEATRLEEVRLATVEDLLDAELRRGAHVKVVAETEALLTAHPVRERLWAHRITALYRSGRQADALAAFNELRHHLVEELGIEPSPELRELELAVLRQDSALAAPPVALAAGSGAGPPGSELPGPLRPRPGVALVGRDAELAWLQARALGLAEDERGFVLLSGEAGIGKTRLAVALAGIVHRTGARVLYGRCDEEPLAAYQPLRRALAGHLRACSDEEILAIGEHELAVLGRLVPDLGSRHATDVRLTELPQDEDRLRLFDAVAAVLRSLTQSEPVLLVIDDLQWADRGSLQLLRHVLSEVPSRLLVAATLRDSEVASTFVEDFLLDLEHVGCPAHRLALTGLPEADLAVLTGAVLTAHAAAVPRELVRALHRITGGNPFFAREILCHLVETGDVSPSRVREVPGSVRAVIERRLSGLPASARRVLAAASVVGHQFELDLLVRTTGEAEDAVLDAVETAAQARLVDEPPATQDVFAFGHPLIRETLYQGLLGSRRRRLHLTVADALEKLVPDGSTAHLAATTHHLRQAGPLAESHRLVDVATRAGDAAMAVAAHEEAARLYAIAVEAAGLGGAAGGAGAPGAPAAPVGEAGARLLVSLGEAQVLRGDPAGRDTLAAAAAVAREVGSAEQLARAALVLAQDGVAMAYFSSDLVELLEQALAACGPEDSALRARLLGRLGFELFNAPPVQGGGRELVDEAVAVARRVGDPTALASALSHRRFYHRGDDHPAGLLSDGHEIVDCAERAGDPVLAWQGRVSIAAGLYQQADLDGALAQLARIEEDAETFRRPRMRWWATNARAGLASFRGDLARAEELAVAAYELGERAGESNALGFFLINLYIVRWLQGRLEELAQPIRDYLAEFPVVSIGRCAQPMVELECGGLSEARDLLDDLAASDFAAVPRTTDWFPGMVLLAEVAARVGAEGHCRTLYRLLRPHAGLLVDEGSMAGGGGPMARYLGLLASALGRHDEAVRHLEASVALCRRLGARPWLALSLHDLAQALVARRRPGDGARASTLAVQAAALADEIGMTALRRRLDATGVHVL
jgi:DNA-binding SARP family transcriptional activator/tetratricopeptide (TPR) repeat protein/energy-coupling factor transporter ATP-binding protein EcfA2